MTEETRYVDDPFEDEDYGRTARRRPKWQSPSTPFQLAVLSAAKRKYWPDKDVRHEFIMIEKAMQPITTVTMPDMPIEWVRHCAKWFRNKNKRGFIPLKGLLTFIHDEDKKSDFIRKNRGSILEQIEVDDDDPYG